MVHRLRCMGDLVFFHNERTGFKIIYSILDDIFCKYLNI